MLLSPQGIGEFGAGEHLSIHCIFDMLKSKVVSGKFSLPVFK